MTKPGACFAVPQHYAPGCVRTGTISRTLTVAAINLGTNAHNCLITSSKVYTTIYPLGHWYMTKRVKKLLVFS
jgi:hypothetical protein